MTLLGNILWIIFGGLVGALLWIFFGIILSITIIGIPYGRQCFKMARLQLMPFGREVVDEGTSSLGLLANLLWIVLFGWELALANLISALFFALTIIGLPFARQNLKLARLSLMPFGKRIRKI